MIIDSVLEETFTKGPTYFSYLIARIVGKYFGLLHYAIYPTLYYLLFIMSPFRRMTFWYRMRHCRRFRQEPQPGPSSLYDRIPRSDNTHLSLWSQDGTCSHSWCLSSFPVENLSSGTKSLKQKVLFRD